MTSLHRQKAILTESLCGGDVFSTSRKNDDFGAAFSGSDISQTCFELFHTIGITCERSILGKDTVEFCLFQQAFSILEFNNDRFKLLSKSKVMSKPVEIALEVEEVAFEAMSLLMIDGTTEWWSEYDYFQTLLEDHQPPLPHKSCWPSSHHLK